MFVAWRELRFARGRFVMIAAVVALITLLVGFLGGLTQGLANANITALTGMRASGFVFSPAAAGKQVSFSASAISSAQQRDWSAHDGVSAAAPVGISMAEAHAGALSSDVAAFGVDSDFAPVAEKGMPLPRSGSTVLSSGAAEELHVAAGDTVRVGTQRLRVQAVFGSAQYSHTSVVWLPLPTWQRLAAAGGQSSPYASVLAVTGDSASFAAAAAATDTVEQGTLSSLLAIGSFRSEIGSLLMMMALLFGISALVVGAFFTVWTMQRAGDIAVLKALGATTGSLVRDCLGQALVVLVIGVGVGIGITAGVGSLLGGTVPFVVSALTTALPAVVMTVLGLAGAAFALRSVTSADPLTALGARGA